MPVHRQGTRLHTISKRDPASGGMSPLDLGGLCVSVEHGSGVPPGEGHEVAFIAAVGEPLVGKGVAELMPMQPRYPGVGAHPVKHVGNPAG